VADTLKGKANLHLHTYFSDGELSPQQVVEAHRAAGFSVIALTDHDTLAGLDAVSSETDGLQVLSGVELSIEDEPERGLVEVHLLGYAFDASNRQLRERLAVASREREAQKRETVRRLNQAGIQLDWDEVRSRATGNVGKPHIVAALEARHPQLRREELYRMMGPGGEAHVPRAKDLKLEEAVELIKEAGGVAVLAHPGVYDHVPDLELLFKTARGAGVEGLEVSYPQAPDDPYGPKTANLIERFATVARRMGWIATGGDDFHGAAVTPKIRLAGWTLTPASVVNELLARAG
jgi:predicted metal-dependent phosphoesterase TrpH